MKSVWVSMGTGLLVLALSGNCVCAGSAERQTVESAVEVVRGFAGLSVAAIPPTMLRDATGVAVIPQMVKAGFLVGGRYGQGVVLPRRPDGTWGDPVFVTLAGGGFGLQAGIQSADVILVFKTANSLDRILRGKGKVTLGGDAGIAAGPVGRQAEAATDGQLKAEIYSYSRSRGLFAGVSLNGAGIWANTEANQAFAYRPTAVDVAAVSSLKAWLTHLSPPAAAVVVPIQAPAPVVVPIQTPPPPPAPVLAPPRPVSPNGR